MKVLGLFLILIGAAAYGLPKMGVAIPTMFEPVMKYTPWGEIGAVALGLLLIAMAPKKKAPAK